MARQLEIYWNSTVHKLEESTYSLLFVYHSIFVQKKIFDGTNMVTTVHHKYSYSVHSYLGSPVALQSNLRKLCNATGEPIWLLNFSQRSRGCVLTGDQTPDHSELHW